MSTNKKYLKFRTISGSKIKSALQFKAIIGNSDFQVEFKKKSTGEDRVMNGSVNVNRMPSFLQPKKKDDSKSKSKSKPRKEKNPDILSLLDTDEMSWKSLDVSTLKKVTFVEGR